MKKLSIMLLSLILCITLFGCSADVSEVQNTQTNTSAQTTSAIIAESSNQSTSTNDNTEITAQGQSGNTTSKTTNADRTENNNSSGNNQSDTTTESTSAKNQKNPPVAATTAAKKQTQPTTTKKQTTTSSTITCAVTIECTTVLDNMDNLKDGHEEYVPSDGYIINGYSVSLPSDSTAYDAVKTACDNQGISINVVSSSYGKYIAGFNNIDEKDCGNQSGWLYKVNGKSPSKSCNKYTLSNGDNVVFTYTCS